VKRRHQIFNAVLRTLPEFRTWPALRFLPTGKNLKNEKIRKNISRFAISRGGFLPRAPSPTPPSREERGDAKGGASRADILARRPAGFMERLSLEAARILLVMKVAADSTNLAPGRLVDRFRI